MNGYLIIIMDRIKEVDTLVIIDREMGDKKKSTVTRLQCGAHSSLNPPTKPLRPEFILTIGNRNRAFYFYFHKKRLFIQTIDGFFTIEIYCKNEIWK
jgi:hypothetical protein